MSCVSSYGYSLLRRCGETPVDSRVWPALPHQTIRLLHYGSSNSYSIHLFE